MHEHSHELQSFRWLLKSSNEFHIFSRMREPPQLLQVILKDQPNGEWRVLVACIFLNCTTRKCVEPIANEFFRRWPDPASFLRSDEEEVKLLIKPLGFVNRRFKRLLDMSNEYIKGTWRDARQLPGIGEYGGRCHDMLFKGIIGEDPPNDHALLDYWNYAISS